MFKKVVRLICIILLLTLISSFTIYSPLDYIEALGNIQNNYIDTKLIENYNSSDMNVRDKAKKEIISICLENAGYENWEDYIDYINMKIYSSNVIPNGEEELIIALNLSKDVALISIFNKTEGSYRYFDTIEDLSPIDEIKFIKIPEKDYNMLIIYQTIDERLGAFYYKKYFDVYIYENESFKKILDETLYYEEIYNTKWIDSEELTGQWIRKIVENEINFLNNGDLKILVNGKKSEYAASDKNTIPPLNDFKIVDKETYNYTYYWNEEFQNFSILNESLSYNGSNGIILEDTDLNFGYSENNESKYKLLKSNGKIIYIDKKLLHRD